MTSTHPRNPCHKVALLVSMLFVQSGFLAHAGQVVVDFDNVDVPIDGQRFPGDLYSDLGVELKSGSIPDNIAIGDVVAFSNPVDVLRMSNRSSWAASAPNHVLVAGGQDVLMSFSTPVTSVALTSDANPNENAGDVIRLIALEATGDADEFRVLASTESLDDAVAAPDNRLSVGLDGEPFSYAVFQITGTVPEGFDDLTFSQVPEPASMALLAIAGTVLVATRRIRS